MTKQTVFLWVAFRAVHFLYVVDRIFNSVHEVKLLLKLMIDGAHPFVVELNWWCHANEADARALRVSGTDEEFFATRVFDILQSHFVHLKKIVYCKDFSCEMNLETNLYVRFIDIRWIRELRLLANDVRENNVLLE